VLAADGVFTPKGTFRVLPPLPKAELTAQSCANSQSLAFSSFWRQSKFLSLTVSSTTCGGLLTKTAQWLMCIYRPGGMGRPIAPQRQGNAPRPTGKGVWFPGGVVYSERHYQPAGILAG